MYEARMHNGIRPVDVPKMLKEAINLLDYCRQLGTYGNNSYEPGTTVFPFAPKDKASFAKFIASAFLNDKFIEGCESLCDLSKFAIKKWALLTKHSTKEVKVN